MILNLDEISFVGSGLSRPECVVAHSSGMIFVPDWTGQGGISVVFSDGTVKRHLAKNWDSFSKQYGFDEPLRPNGICLLDGGDFLLAHLGAEKGGVFRLQSNGMVSPVLLEIDGVPLPPSNFVIADDHGRIWVTVSTRQTPRAAAYRSDVADGFVAVINDGETRIVADNLGYTNEAVPHPDGKRLFVNETFARRLTSFDIGANGSLTNRKTVAEFGPGTFPDGLTFDENGDIWITSIVSNRVLRVRDGGDVDICLEDVDRDHLQWAEAAFKENQMGRPHLDKAAGRRLSNISNLAFFGPELQQAVMGCLLDDKLPMLDMPVRGHQPFHWDHDLAPLLQALSPISALNG